MAMHDALQRHYDEIYAQADPLDLAADDHRTPYPRTRFEAAATTLYTELPRGSSVLELGDGRIGRSILRARPDLSRLVLTDVSAPRLARLAETEPHDPRVEVRHLDVDRAIEGVVPTVDAVIMAAVIEHLIDPLRAMIRVRELLNPGGFVYIETPNIAKWSRRVKLGFGRFPSTASRDEGLVTYEGAPVDLYDQGHLHYFTFRSLRRMLVERCGYSAVTPAPYCIGWFPPRLGHHLACLRPGLFSELSAVARV